MARKAKEPLKVKTDEKPFGRPSLYTPEMVDLICERVAKHPWGIDRICDYYNDLPNQDTIAEWRAKYEDFSEKYLDAKRRQTHLLAEDNDKKAESLKDYTYSDPISGATKIDSGIVAMINLQMRNNQWQMARLNPRYYGDKQIVETKNSSDDEIKKSLTEIRDKLSEKSKREY